MTYYCFYREPVDHRTRRDRTELCNRDWKMQLPDLVRAYLEFCEHDRRLPHEEDQLLEGSEMELFEIRVVDIFGIFSLHFLFIRTLYSFHSFEKNMRLLCVNRCLCNYHPNAKWICCILTTHPNDCHIYPYTG